MDGAEQTDGKILALARRQFLQDARIDLPALGQVLGLSRATLYRRIGNLDKLMGAVIVALVDEASARGRRAARGRGARRVLRYQEHGLREIAGFRPLMDFLARDPQRGLRLIASRDGPVQARTIAHAQRLLEEEVERGALRLATDAHTMAYALTRIAESFLYADLIAGEPADVDQALRIMAAMLGAPVKG